MDTKSAPSVMKNSRNQQLQSLQCLTCLDKPLLRNDDDPIIIIAHLMGGHVLVDAQQQETVRVEDIVNENRIREDYGDVAALAKSIKEFGIIQPIVLVQHTGKVTLVAGGRRLAAIRSLGIKDLLHSRDFIWREESDDDRGKLRLQAVELEENLRRQDLHWSEVIKGKARLLTIMQNIHGESKGQSAGRSRGNDGFGVLKLASMLGEAHSTTSRDLELAKFVEKHPMLAALPTRADAQRKLGVAVTVAAMQSLAKRSSVPSQTDRAEEGTDAARTKKPDTGLDAASVIPEQNWRLYSGRFQDSILQVGDDSVDLVLTDLPYNIGLGDSTAAHGAGLGQFTDTSIDMDALCSAVAVESYRVLRQDRFAVFFFGFAYYKEFYDALTQVGFTVDTYPFIWIRDRTAPPDGSRRYSKCYDPALICSKGDARFIRPNLSNSVSIASCRGADRLHASQKPLALMEKFVLDMTTEGCIVLDMFAGAGTTGEAALRNKRKTILFELEENNCTLIRSRLGIL